MPSPSIQLVVNMSDPRDKRKFMAQLESTEGIYNFRATPKGEPHSDLQARYYHGEVVKRFVDFLNAQDYEVTKSIEAHRYLRDRFLGRSTRELTVSEFWSYCFRCIAWLADFFGIVCEDPSPELVKSRRPDRISLE